MSSVTNNDSGQPGGVCPSFENAPLDRRVFSLTLRCGEKFAFPHSRLSNREPVPKKFLGVVLPQTTLFEGDRYL